MAEPAPYTVDHVAVLVRSIDDALGYYRDRLGLRVLSDETVAAVNARLLLLDGGATKLQLVEPTGPGPLQTHLETQGEGLHHLCFAVADIDAAIKQLAPDAGVAVNLGGRGRRTAFLPSAANNLRVELVENGPVRASQGEQ